MSYKELTVFNYKVSYYAVRIFTLYWLLAQYQIFANYQQRSGLFYYPTVFIQKIIFPSFPQSWLFVTLVFVSAILIITSLVRQSYMLNILIFLMLCILNLPVIGYMGLSHTNHLLLLAYFLSIFLLPKQLKTNDYKNVQFYLLGLLLTYSAAGLWKILYAGWNVMMNRPGVSWFELDAAKFNTYSNFHYMDAAPPAWMIELYQYPHLWLIITIAGVFMQFFCFIGAINRNYLTLTMMFLFVFHLYTKYFVIADLGITKYVVLVLFFPYHHFHKLLGKMFPNIFSRIANETC